MNTQKETNKTTLNELRYVVRKIIMESDNIKISIIDYVLNSIRDQGCIVSLYDVDDNLIDRNINPYNYPGMYINTVGDVVRGKYVGGYVAVQPITEKDIDNLYWLKNKRI